MADEIVKTEKTSNKPPSGRNFGDRRQGRQSRPSRRPRTEREYDQRVVEIKRVSRTVKGGKRMRFRALVVIGDRKGSVGLGLRKGMDVSEAIGKAAAAAQKNMVKISLKDGTIPHEIKEKYKSSTIFLKPASSGTGVIAGGSVRQLLDLAGVTDILSKSYGSRNKVNVLQATLNALKDLQNYEELKQERRGKK